MDQPVSASEAYRSFSQILGEVRAGQSFVVTVHGKQVAHIVPCTEAADGRTIAQAVLFDRLASQAVTESGRWSRDELYER